jgi:hypothetical protein
MLLFLERHLLLYVSLSAVNILPESLAEKVFFLIDGYPYINIILRVYQ